ncbi:Protein IMPACT [Vanrija pseudolonga]|uniref:Protein IMPACT n=1 Tax=Vanrija pseudolonga TaxID=143232 RepID=A0AAF0Y833_9TREE|nr:Protein IMPACT [Vanrija pseudolonga]
MASIPPSRAHTPDAIDADLEAAKLESLIDSLSVSDDTNTAALADELGALHSIYPGTLRLLESDGRIRFEIALPAWEGSLTGAVGEDEPPTLRVLVTLRPGYPASVAPQLQLLGLYLGSYPIDAGLFGDVTRTYITSAGVPFTPGDVCVFDGLVYVQGLAGAWYAERLASAEAHAGGDDGTQSQQQRAAAAALAALALDTRPLPNITSSEPITDRKSAFVGHAARILDERDVAAVVQHLLQDRKIARAAHPTIYAYRIVRDVGGVAGKVVEADYDDDGETQAGSRLKHLLEILELDNVLVVVTRWFGGIHLGPDRFKHINQAARDALEAAKLLDEPVAKGRRKK